MNRKLKTIIGITGIITMTASLTACSSNDETFTQALAAKAYNDVTSCYQITNLQSSDAKASTGKTNGAAFTGESVIIQTLAHVHAHSSGGSHSYGGSSSHSSGGSSLHGYTGRNAHDMYTTGKNGESGITMKDANAMRESGKLADGTNADKLQKNLTSDGAESTGNASRSNSHPYYIPMVYSHYASNDNKDKNKYYKDIASDEFFDLMIDAGALFCWFFHYMPVGNGAVKELLPTPEQRAYVYHQIRKFRSEKPIFTMDFQNDAQYVGGCIAGGRRYLHINAKGDVEPCVFIHYSNCNIHDTTLLDALRSPLFQAYHDNQPFNENMLRPCPMLENAGRIQELVKQSKAVNTDYESLEDVDHLLEKTVPYAKNWKPMADKLWNEQKK